MAGLVNGFLVTKVKLSSLVATLGMNFLLRGLIYIGRQGYGITTSQLRDTPFFNFFVGDLNGFPVHMIWGILFAVVGWLLFSRHRFGAQVAVVGDNQDSAREMGINVDRVKTTAYVYMGLAAAIAGLFSTLINATFYPTTGDGYLLPVLAAVFVGGTPTWGGVGTVVGGCDRRFHCRFYKYRHRWFRPDRLLYPVLLRPGHHPVIDQPPLQPGPLPLLSV